MSDDNGAANLADAISQVDKLDELLSTMADSEGTTCFEIQPGSIRYQADFDTNFEDRNGFVTGIAKYMEEATVHSALNELLEEGENHAVMLYTWRCCTRGIPSPKSNEDPNREEIHMMTVEVLLPEVDKLYNLMKFHKIAIDRFCDEVKVLCHHEKRKEFVSSAYLLTLGKFINMFAVLDELKNIKSSVKIDFSTFRRAALFLKLMNDSQALQESQNLSVFLATPNRIRDNLKENLEKIQNYEFVLADVISICVTMFEQKLYVTLDEKHLLVKVIGFCLGLVDNSRCNMYKLDSKKKIRIDKIDRIFKSVEVVPLYGDMQISPFNYIKSSSHYDGSKWPNCSGSSTTAPIDLVKLLPHISQDHLKYLNELQQHNLTVSSAEFMSEADNERMFNLALKGLQLLSGWSSLVLELHSFKLLHPTDHHQHKDCPQDAEEYERAIRYNYTDAEKSALVHLIVMIKGLQDVMLKMETTFAEGIRRDIYLKLQTFVQGTLREPLRKAMKHKKEVLRSVLMSIRDTCAEWMGGGSSLNQTYQKGPIEVRILKRFVGPSSTQLYLVRTMLESLLSDKTCAKRELRKDLDSAHLPGIEDFHRRTFFWKYLLNFSEILEKCCDLGQMWYREFYLELTMGRKIQFPIEMSMPWILIEHVLRHPNLVEFALFPLDLYNDSANCALNVFKKQWLLDEIIAEVNLCFDQFVYKLSEQIYSYYKRLAAISLLNRRFHNDWIDIAKEPVPPVIAVKYEGLMKQRRVLLIGHHVDLNQLLRQRISSDIMKSLEAALAKFEEGDLTGVVHLEALIQLNRETHKMLKSWIPSLDDFSSLWKQVDRTVTAPYGRTIFHILSEITGDLVPNYCFNGSTKRFVKSQGLTYSKRTDERSTASPVPPHYLWGSKQLNTAYSIIFSLYSEFIGEPHFRVIANLLGYQGLALVMKELVKICEGLITGRIRPWIKILKDSVLPKYVKAPNGQLNEEGTPGLLAYYLQVLSSVIAYPGVKTELCQHFREVGNSMLVCLLMEQSVAAEESLQMCHVAAFQGTQKQEGQASKTGDNHNANVLGKVETLMKSLHVSENIAMFGTETQRNLARESELLSHELLTFGMRIFPEIVKKIGEILNKKCEDGTDEEAEGNRRAWTGPPPVNQVMNMHRCGEYHRVWSALQFMFCIPVGPNEFTVEQLFGDGLNWAGCAFIALLGQEKRYQIFDFCNHLRESYKHDGKAGEVRGVDVQKIVRKIRSMQVLNDGILSMISRYLEDSEFYTTNFSENVRCYPAPVHKSLTENLPPELEGQPPEIVLQYQMQSSQEALDTENKNREAAYSGEEEIQLEKGAVAMKNSVAKSDCWDDFKFFEESERVVKNDGGCDDNNKLEDCDLDGEESSSVSVLYQSEQIVDENASVSSVGCEGSV